MFLSTSATPFLEMAIKFCFIFAFLVRKPVSSNRSYLILFIILSLLPPCPVYSHLPHLFLFPFLKHFATLLRCVILTDAQRGAVTHSKRENVVTLPGFCFPGGAICL